ncbi:MAG: hypothetical protein K0U86_21750 [Planctomycetes bacterium]|nr:hypothetical protein [Planctomycetota bacterium]MCH9727532.1 hypothetical protein [Planctomycetota bacterium]MCH9777488.1 hypothetical protein [Planctomycetota bacterium]MCH9790049.1 hypothetical protein [Planctomycetota bacterium]MDF1743756.1 hypothetical protein [Gimesia sp.]
MADWLKIPSKQKRREEDIPEPYEIVCVCGVSLSGYRRKKPYRHACQQCDETYFILPRNSYPPPKARKKKKQLPTQQQVSEYILNSSLVTRFLEKRALKKASREPRETQPQTVATPKVSPFELPPPRTRLITPFRGILAGIALIIGLTAYGIIHSRKLDQASVTLKAAILSGEALLKKNDLVGADAAYQEAFQALEILGRDDPTANEIRQTSRELQAINAQAVSPVFEIAEEAVSNIKQNDLASWESLFNVRYADTWMIFETTLIPLPVKEAEEDAQTPRFRLNLPIMLDEYTLSLELTSPTFLTYLEQHPGQPLIFAAQIKSFRQEPNQQGAGTILLNGETAFLWSHLKLYEQLGIQFDEFHDRKKIEAMLNQQSQYLGVSK